MGIFNENDHAAFLLYESGMFKKSLQSLELGDKTTIVQELKDSILYNAWPAIMHLKQGLQNLNVLSIIRNNADLMRSFFCHEPPILSPGKLQD